MTHGGKEIERCPREMTHRIFNSIIVHKLDGDRI